jgi:CRISPR-associated protein Cmr2
MALSSTDKAFKLTYEVQGEFTEDWVGYEPLQGETRSMSGGLLITYYKEPLYIAVPDVNGLEHLAKESGRNALAIGYRKHSGAFYRVAVNWELFKGSHYSSLLREFERGKISRKLIYELDTTTWPNEPRAVLNLLKYEFLRHSNYGKKEKNELIEAFANFLWLVRNVRAFLTKEDLRRMENGPEESRLERLNEEIKELIVSDPEKSQRFGWENVKALAEELIDDREPQGEAWFDELSERLGVELAGVVLKKQIRGASVLLKILLETEVGA